MGLFNEESVLGKINEGQTKEGEPRYMRGAFVSYEPGKFPKTAVYIPFRGNPDNLSRVIKIETGQGGSGTYIEKSKDKAKQVSADDVSGILTETFTIKVRFDLAERFGYPNTKPPPKYGILPEIAAMESLMYPFNSKTAAATDSKKTPVKMRALRKITLLLFGRYLVLPVRINQMTITEQLHNPQLIPIRCEIDVQCEVMDIFEVRGNKASKAALEFQEKRRNLAAKLALQASQDLIFSTLSI